MRPISHKSLFFLAVSVAAVVAALVAPQATQAGWPFGNKVKKTNSPLVEASKIIDDLEHDLNKDGTVVIKAPDVWGEARLTKHRREFEKQMAEQIDQFELLLNASIRRSDQAFLASALAISNAAQGQAADGSPSPPTASNSFGLVNNLIPGESVGDDAENVPIVRTGPFQLGRGDKAQNFGFIADKEGIGLEPTIRLDELKRYLDHLNEIRRVNEGDDTSDSPGYSLNLVRVPVSLLPGAQTRKGHGAEVTITARPHISPELLPRVFQQLVINDLVDQLSPAVRNFAQQIKEYIAYNFEYDPDNCRYYQIQYPEWSKLTEEDQIRALSDPVQIPQLINNYEKIETTSEWVEDLPYWITRARRQALRLSGAGFSRNARLPVPPSQIGQVYGPNQLAVMGYWYWKSESDDKYNTDGPFFHLTDVRAFLKEELAGAYNFLKQPAQFHWWERVPEIQAAIRSNNIAALEAIRKDLITSSTSNYYKVWDAARKSHVTVGQISSPTASAAWWVLVEASLLDAKLQEDMRRVSQDPECHCMTGIGYPSYLPDPPAEAKQAFVDYVNCRWPIHVFALDPVVQQQNIADEFSMRREMQLALALSFASGQTSAQQMTRFARRLEMDMETIALNRTDVAFGHGADTFGWRFYPRVQTPPFESNSVVLFRDLIHGGPNKDQLRRTWEIEPGMRECVAIVLMPSFIEHVTFHARGNYFKMNCPTNVKSTMEENAYWSEQIRALEKHLDCLYCQADRYRFGEIERIKVRVDQLSKRMPLQTVHTRVPNENTLGGFEMFSSGVTDLAPELLDFYGQPGVDTERNTEIFLVGDHFSVHETRVLAGNRECDFDLISRQVMKVTIPPGVQTVKRHYIEEEGAEDAAVKYFRHCPELTVDVHIATPYGVSGHLQLPVINRPSGNVEKLQWNQDQIAVLYKFEREDTDASSATNYDYTIDSVNVFLRKPHELVLDVPPFRVPAEDQRALDLVVRYDQNRAAVTLGTDADGSFPRTAQLRFDTTRNKLILDGSGYAAFHANLKTAVERLLDTHYASSEPPNLIQLEVTGALGPDSDDEKQAVGRSLRVMVYLELLEN